MNDNETVKTSNMAGNLNRLSKQQKSLLIMAYENYCNNPRLPHTEVDRDLFPYPSLAEIKAGFTWDESWPEFDKLHLYTAKVIAFVLGVNLKFEYVGNGQWFYFGSYSERLWNCTKVDRAKYDSAQASIFRSFKRLDERGLVKRFKRDFYKGSGIKLTPLGIDTAKLITGIEPTIRTWLKNDSAA